MQTSGNRQWLFSVALSFATSSGVAFATDNMTISGSVIGGAPASYHANDGVIWDNGAAIFGSASSQNDTVYPFDSQTADDFRLRDQNPAGADEFVIAGIVWTGHYWGGIPGNPNQGFNILFYADAGGMPTGAGPVDPSPTALLNQFIPLGDANETSTGNTNEFAYDAKLVIPFQANTDTTYWMGIQSQLVFGPQWGWSDSANRVQGNPSRLGFPILGIDYWDSVLADQSFQLTGFEVPEPGGLALFGIGVVAIFRRRRKSPTILDRSRAISNPACDRIPIDLAACRRASRFHSN